MKKTILILYIIISFTGCSLKNQNNFYNDNYQNKNISIVNKTNNFIISIGQIVVLVGIISMQILLIKTLGNNNVHVNNK